jgi:hypothetical protein
VLQCTSRNSAIENSTCDSPIRPNYDTGSLSILAMSRHQAGPVEPIVLCCLGPRDLASMYIYKWPTYLHRLYFLYPFITEQYPMGADCTQYRLPEPRISVFLFHSKGNSLEPLSDANSFVSHDEFSLLFLLAECMYS